MARATIDFRPFSHQARAILSEAQVTAAVTGVRGGKTTAGAFLTAMNAIDQPGFWQPDIDRGEPYNMGVSAPTWPGLHRVALPAVLQAIPKELKVGPYHKSERRQTVVGRHGLTNIWFLSGRTYDESWPGQKMYFFWIDEFPKCKEGVYDEAQARVADRAGRILLTGTPSGPNWAYKRIYEPWKQKKDKDIAFFTWTTLDNPNLKDRRHIEKLRHRLPKRNFRRQFEASWEQFEGQVFEDFVREFHVRRTHDHQFILPDGRRAMSGPKVKIRVKDVIAGVDWGYGKGHPGAIVVCAQDYHDRWWVTEVLRQEGIVVYTTTGDCWVRRAQQLRARWGIECFYCDHDPEHVEQFRRNGLTVQLAHKQHKDAAIQYVAGLMGSDEQLNTRFFVMDTCEPVIEEIQYYHWDDKKEKPVKTMDDAVDAMMYGIYTHTTKGKWTPEPDYEPGVA